MICPRCRTQNEMAYSVLSNGLICLVPGCGFEYELDHEEARLMLEDTTAVEQMETEAVVV